MKEKTYVPPIKTQGTKTKLIKWIAEQINFEIKGRWIEPFMGSGVVGFNIRPKKAIFADKNPHIVTFYKNIKYSKINPVTTRKFLEIERENLLEFGERYYYEVRERFNEYHKPLDFLFLNCSCFNGLVRFNRKGEMNTPFGKKPERFRKAHITKICNQIKYIEDCTKKYDWAFLIQNFEETIKDAKQNDIIYCDPPYLGRNENYFDIWTEKDEATLFELLSCFDGKFILSTWYKTSYRENEFIKKYWKKFNVVTREHFYHLGGKEKNRNFVVEALVLNF